MNVSKPFVNTGILLGGALVFVGAVFAADSMAAEGQPSVAQAGKQGAWSMESASEGPKPAVVTAESPAGDETGDAEADRLEEDYLVRHIVSPWTGDFDGMVKDRLIRALVVHSKTMYYVDKGQQRGIAYEMIGAFQKWINKRYPPKHKHLKAHVAAVPVAGDDLIPALLEGRGDIAVADLTITPGRREQVDFSKPFFFDINEIVVTGPDSLEVSSLNDLSGQQVFVSPTSSYREHLELINGCFEKKGIPLIRIHEVPSVLAGEDLLEMVNAGLLGITVVDDYKAELWSKVLPDIELHPEIVVNAGGEFAWMFRKESPKLRDAINAFAETHRQGTAFGNELVRRNVDHPVSVKKATSAKDIERYRKLIGLFKRYAEQYDLDHRMMMAQGYQESRLNQKARSRVGAVGVMQLMPATGRQMGVGNVGKLEANIHAGIKYHRHLIEHYFDDESMDELNKTLFAFAAYNAGPGRVRGFRKAAKKKGLDPNVWFDNVELISAQKIGLETVSYVANIFKYYVAYKLVEEEEAERRKQKGLIEAQP